MSELNEEAELVRRASQGDRESAARLLLAHEQALFSYLSQVLRSGPDVDDAIQETLLRALENLDQFRGEGRFRAWLFQIARREVLNRWRTRPVVSLHDQSNALLNDSERFEDHPVVRQEEVESIRDTIQRLPDVEREVVWMRLKSDLSFREIAEITGAPLNTVLGRMHNAKERLRQWLEPTTDTTERLPSGF